MVYTQIQRITRDINSITNKMYRLEKQGNTQRVYHLSEIRSVLQEALEDIRTAAK